MKPSLMFLAAFVLALAIVVPAFAVLTEEKTAEELAKEFKKDSAVALERYGEPGAQKGTSIPGDVMVKVTGVVEKIDGKRLALKTNVDGIKLEIAVQKDPAGIKPGDTVRMTHYAHVKDFKTKTIAIGCEAVEKVNVIGK